MKIAQVNTFFYPVIGGVEQYVFNLSLGLAKRGHEVHVFTVNKRHGKLLGPSEEKIRGIYVHRLPVLFDLSYRVKFWPKLLSELLYGNFDIIHTYCQGHFHTLVALLAKRICGTPLVVTTYGPLHTHAEYSFYKKYPLKIYDELVTPSVFNVADKVLARNPLMIPWLKSLGIDEGKIEVTPSGLPEKCLFLREGRAFKSKYKLENKEIIMYVGRINPQKGVQHLLKAAPLILEKISDAFLIFIGPDEIGYANELKKLSEKLGVEERTLILGPIYSLEEEMEAYAACDVFVMPSSFEGFSQAVLRAMAQGKPIVATRVGGLPYQVKHGVEGLLVNYGDEYLLADAVNKILLDHSLAERLGYGAREKARKFVYSVLIDKIESIYLEVFRRGS